MIFQALRIRFGNVGNRNVSRFFLFYKKTRILRFEIYFYESILMVHMVKECSLIFSLNKADNILSKFYDFVLIFMWVMKFSTTYQIKFITSNQSKWIFNIYLTVSCPIFRLTIQHQIKTKFIRKIIFYDVISSSGQMWLYVISCNAKKTSIMV